MGSKFAYTTLLTATSYLAGVLVLAQCLRSVNSKYPLVVMVTASLPEKARAILLRQAICIREVEVLRPSSDQQPINYHDARFADTWTKLRCVPILLFPSVPVYGNGSGPLNLWNIVKLYQRVVLLDSDMIILRNMDDLMAMDLPSDHIAAAHVCTCNPRGFLHYPRDWIPSHCPYSSVKHPTSPPPWIRKDSPRSYYQLNSGTVVLNPSTAIFASIKHLLASSPKVSEWTFPDQDLLSEHFRGKWKPLAWYYNALRSLSLVHPAIWADHEIRCLHYIFADKPWKSRSTPKGSEPSFDIMNQWWWARFDRLGESMAKHDPAGWRFLLSSVGADTVQ